LYDIIYTEIWQQLLLVICVSETGKMSILTENKSFNFLQTSLAFQVAILNGLIIVLFC